MTDGPITNPKTTPSTEPVAEAVLPSGIPIARRIQTFNMMQRAIETCARALHEAFNHFQAARHVPQEEVARQISTGRRHVLHALYSLHPIEELIEANPEPMNNTYRCLVSCQQAMRTIERVSYRLQTKPTTPHLQTALSALVRACPRASLEIENNLGGPIQKARDEIANLAHPGDALTA